MSIREIAMLVGFVGFVAILLGALTPRGLHDYEEAVRVPHKKSTVISGEEGR